MRTLQEKRELIELLCEVKESAPSAVHLVWTYHFEVEEPPYEPYEFSEGYNDPIRNTIINSMSEDCCDRIITMYQTEYPEDWMGDNFQPYED